jgi:branched-chain amino acid transport system ATP-binding protein
MLFSIDNIRVNYDSIEVIKGASIEVAENAIVSLIGSNGAGKTTILRSTSGLKAITSGEIWFSGKRIDRLSPVEIIRMGISHVPEGRRVFPYMRVAENLLMGAFVRKDKVGVYRDLHKVFHLFPRLEERSRQQAGTLSGGEQQMLAIGRALMSKPKLLLMDEPSLGLAPKIVSDIGKLITAINQSGTTIVLVEQNARMALRVSHKGYLLETGSIVLEGPTKELIDNEKVKKTYLGIK